MIELLRETLHRSELGLEDREIQLLDKHWLLLETANQQFNLTAIEEETAAVTKHYLDSLLILPRLRQLIGNKEAKLADIGSGGGFPGLPLAICLPKLSVTLIEATGKKCAFLESCAKALNLNNVSVVKLRAEEAGQNKSLRTGFDFITARAVAPLNVLLEYALPLLKLDGRLLAYKGSDYEREIREATGALSKLGGEISAIYDFNLPDSNGQRHIIEVSKLKPTPGLYPRRPGQPTQKPL